ncbi:unnamed protein product, partial [Amoebophrya sp. A25]
AASPSQPADRNGMQQPFEEIPLMGLVYPESWSEDEYDDLMEEEASYQTNKALVVKAGSKSKHPTKPGQLVTPSTMEQARVEFARAALAALSFGTNFVIFSSDWEAKYGRSECGRKLLPPRFVTGSVRDVTTKIMILDLREASGFDVAPTAEECSELTAIAFPPFPNGIHEKHTVLCGISYTEDKKKGRWSRRASRIR